MNALELKLSDAVTLAVPASLQSITTYVLLEQERWFEKEMDFLLSPLAAAGNDGHRHRRNVEFTACRWHVWSARWGMWSLMNPAANPRAVGAQPRTEHGGQSRYITVRAVRPRARGTASVSRLERTQRAGRQRRAANRSASPTWIAKDAARVVGRRLILSRIECRG